MFGLPWDRDPRNPRDPYDPSAFSSFLFRQSQDRRSRSGRYPPRSFPVPLPPSFPPSPHPQPLSQKPPKQPKQTRFSASSPTGSDYTDSDWDDTYALDTDPLVPAFPGISRTRDTHSPGFTSVCVNMPRTAAAEQRLRTNETLFLPALIRLRIRIILPQGIESFLAAAPVSMSFGDVTAQVVRCYAGKRVAYSTRVKQRGRMCEAAQDAVLEDLARRGEVWRDGRREMAVEIVVGREEDWCGGRERLGRGPGGGERDTEIEMVRKREVSLTRYARKC